VQLCFGLSALVSHWYFPDRIAVGQRSTRSAL
jgi:hypothetical protein